MSISDIDMRKAQSYIQEHSENPDVLEGVPLEEIYVLPEHVPLLCVLADVHAFAETGAHSWCIDITRTLWPPLAGTSLEQLRAALEAADFWDLSGHAVARVEEEVAVREGYPSLLAGPAAPGAATSTAAQHDPVLREPYPVERVYRDYMGCLRLLRTLAETFDLELGLRPDQGANDPAVCGIVGAPPLPTRTDGDSEVGTWTAAQRQVYDSLSLISHLEAGALTPMPLPLPGTAGPGPGSHGGSVGEHIRQGTASAQGCTVSWGERWKGCAAALDIASSYCRHDVVESLLACGCGWHARSCLPLVRRKLLTELKWMRGRGCPLHADAFTEALKRKDAALIAWLRDPYPRKDHTGKTMGPCPADKETCQAAAEYGDLELLRWLLARAETNCAGTAKAWMSPRVLAAACAGGHLSVVQELWCVHGCRGDRAACAAAARGGNWDILKFLRSARKGEGTVSNAVVDWDSETALAACEGGHLRLLQWCVLPYETLKAQGVAGTWTEEEVAIRGKTACPWYIPSCRHTALKHGHTEVVAWISSQREPAVARFNAFEQDH